MIKLTVLLNLHNVQMIIKDIAKRFSKAKNAIKCEVRTKICYYVVCCVLQKLIILINT